MRPRITPKAAIIGAVGMVLVVVGTTAQAGWLFVLAAGVLGLAVAGGLAIGRIHVEIRRSLPDGDRPRAGDSVEVVLELRNLASRRSPVMRVTDSLPGFEDVALACESLPPDAVAKQKVLRHAVQRGVFDGSDVVLTTAAPFGLVRRTKKVSLPSRTIVHPRWGEVGSFTIPDTPAATADEALAVARAGHGDVFAGVREYRPGDPRRSIHWRTTARSGRLAVREHEEPARSPVVLVVGGDPRPEEAEDWERLIAGVASLGLYALSVGRPVSCAGRSRLGDYVTDATRLQLLDWTAGLEAPGAAHEELVASAFRRWGRRCSFVLFSLGPEEVDRAVRAARARGAHSRVVTAGVVTVQGAA